mmetsp:Transcript_9644/g.21523  ORF Transcript_9644/g.21523 Transcript_9644/m.21523 type:complete len:86 (+) Transcript_9644:340-597(+)
MLGHKPMSGALLGLSSKFQDVLAQKQHLASLRYGSRNFAVPSSLASSHSFDYDRNAAEPFRGANDWLLVRPLDGRNGWVVARPGR